MKKYSMLLIAVFMCNLFMGCSGSYRAEGQRDQNLEGNTVAEVFDPDAVQIHLSDEKILIDGEEISEDEDADVYRANDIIFYLEGQGISYGEGSGEEEHTQEEADAHTVIHITKPGTYEMRGKLSAGQIFVDLGKSTKNDPDAVVTLVLNNVDLTCSVAPAVFFYRVYECSEDDPEEASMEVDLTGAGANVVIADGSENFIRGSHVAKIYESCELSEDGTKVVDSTTLHKYDGAFYSRRSMNIYGDTGVLNIIADSEGLDSDLHMNIHGGIIRILSGNDGINTSEDGISVFTMNGGNLYIRVTGESGEGDGIDSNGWLVINGGSVVTQACSNSPDSGLDCHQDIRLNGGTIVSTGNMLDHIAEESQPYQVFSCRERVSGGTACTIKAADGETFIEITPENDFQILVISSADMKKDETYSLWKGETQIAEGTRGAVSGGFGKGQGGPGKMERPDSRK